MSEIISLDEALKRLKIKKADELGVEPDQIGIKERVHIEKFDGGRADIAAGLKPSEYVIIEDGKVVHREINGEKEG
jgi:hypothetical protein